MYSLRLDSVANSAVFPRNWASFTPVPRKGGIAVAGCGFWGFFLCTCRYFQKKKIKIRHSLRLIINTVNYPIQSRVMFLND